MVDHSLALKASVSKSVCARLLFTAFAFFIFTLAAHSISAATFTVDNNSDTAGQSACTAAANDCNLPGAVGAARNAAGDDTIVFAAGITNITLTTTPEIYLDSVGGSVTITGPGANVLTIDGGAGTNRIFRANGAVLNLSGVTLTGGNGEGGEGGAVSVFGGRVIVNGVHFTGNTGALNGGGISIVIGGNHRIENSTFSGNTATQNGGAIYVINTNLTIVNSTVSGNSASNVGGGIVGGGAGLTLRSVTVTDNSAPNGGGVQYNNSTFDFGNSIIAGNTATTNYPEIYFFSGTTTSQGYNLVGDSGSGMTSDSNSTGTAITYQSTDIRDTPPLLDALANYGGTVPTRRLQPTSPAIDKGSAVAGVTSDGRRVIRPYDILATANATGGNGADIGAYELIPTSAFGWGYNFFGQVGDGTQGTDRNLPTAIAGGFVDIVGVEGGYNHALGLRSNGTLLAWGSNNNGKLANLGNTIPAPIAVPGLTNVVAAAGGENHSLALLSNGTVMAWGAGSRGQLGDGTTPTTRVAPGAVSGITTAVAIAAGLNSSYALLADGSVRAWGRNDVGQLGDGSTTARTTPVQVSGLTGGVVSFDGGGDSGYAVLSDGSVRAWGFNNFGQLGDGTTNNSTTPVTPTGLAAGAGVVQIAGGVIHAAALKSDGTVLSWGRNDFGQLGNGGTTDSSTPTATSISNVTQIKSSIGQVTYARLRDGRLFAWGVNAQGEGGNGTTSTTAPFGLVTPTAVSIDQGIGFFGANEYGGYAGSPLASVATGAPFVRLGDATVNFVNVATAGTAQIRTFDPSASGLTLPTGYTVVANSNGYDITSSAQFTGTATVCLKVQNVIDATTFNRLYILHDDDGDGTLDVVNVTRDYQKREICRPTSSFSPFVLAQGLAPTAASVSISGRVITPQELGLTNAFVTLTDMQGNSRTIRTGKFGAYRFTNVIAGETYILSVISKRYTYAPQIITVNEDMTEVNFTAQ